MIDRNAVELALLVNVVRNKDWDIIIRNGIRKEYFTVANRPLYDYIYDYYMQNKYPDIQVMCYEFDIDNVAFQSYIEIEDLQGLCKILVDEYVKSNVKYEVQDLNTFAEELNENPRSYIERLGNKYEKLKEMAYVDKAVDILDNLDDNVMNIDPSNVISTGFKELDEKLIGWKRGEDLIVFMARTGQGKSWFGLKFALAAALKGERVGIYSGEMSLKELQSRIVCCAKQEYTSTNEEAIAFLREKKPYIKIITPTELRRRATVDDIDNLVVTHNLTYVVVDQLSLMEDRVSSYNLQIRQKYGNITNDLFSLSQRRNLPITLLVQSNRQGANATNGPELENIAESDAVAQNATRVISMKKENGILTLRVVKNRYGNSDGIIKYEVDYGINKYRVIQDFEPNIASINRAQAKAMFGQASSRRGASNQWN